MKRGAQVGISALIPIRVALSPLTPPYNVLSITLPIQKNGHFRAIQESLVNLSKSHFISKRTHFKVLSKKGGLSEEIIHLEKAGLSM